MITKVIKEALDSLTTAVDGFTEKYEAYQDQFFQAAIPADLASGTFEKTIFTAPFNVVVVDVSVIPDADIGQATNYMTLDVQNKGADGTGTTSIGSRTVNSTNKIEGFVGVDLVTTNANVTKGHSLSLKKTVTGDGEAFPGGLVVVKYKAAA